MKISKDTLKFMRDPYVAAAISDSIENQTRLSLSERSLSLVLRTALLEASMFERIASYLSSLESFQIAPSEYECQILKQPVYSEVIRQLQKICKGVSDQSELDQLPNLTQRLEAGSLPSLPLELYEQLFSVRSRDDQSGLAARTSQILSSMSGGLIVQSSENLTLEHLGGSDVVQEMMSKSLNRQGELVLCYEDAYSKDRVRRLYENLTETKQHHIRTATGAWFRGLAVEEKCYLIDRIIENASDAAMVRQARALYSDGISAEQELKILSKALTELRLNPGLVAGRDGEGEIDLSATKPLDAIASGCQVIVEALSRKASVELSIFDQTQAASRVRRNADNTSFFAFLGSGVDYDRKEYKKPITASNLWEYLGIASDVEQQDALYCAFSRRFGSWFKGTSGDSGWDKFELGLKRDGTLSGRFHDTIYEDEPREPFNLFEAVQKKDRPFPKNYTGSRKARDFSPGNDPFGLYAELHARNMRTDIFHPNVAVLVREIKAESEWFEQLLAEVKKITSDTSLLLERVIQDAPREVVKTGLLQTIERLALLRQYVTPDVTPWLITLGLSTDSNSLGSLTEREVKEAFNKQLLRNNAYPDHHQDDPIKMREAGTDQQALREARNNLVSCVKRGVFDGVSGHLGQPLEAMQWPPQDSQEV